MDDDFLSLQMTLALFPLLQRVLSCILERAEKVGMINRERVSEQSLGVGARMFALPSAADTRLAESFQGDKAISVSATLVESVQ